MILISRHIERNTMNTATITPEQFNTMSSYIDWGLLVVLFVIAALVLVKKHLPRFALPSLIIIGICFASTAILDIAPAILGFGNIAYCIIDAVYDILFGGYFILFAMNLLFATKGADIAAHLLETAQIDSHTASVISAQAEKSAPAPFIKKLSPLVFFVVLLATRFILVCIIGFIG